MCPLRATDRRPSLSRHGSVFLDELGNLDFKCLHEQLPRPFPRQFLQHVARLFLLHPCRGRLMLWLLCERTLFVYLLWLVSIEGYTLLSIYNIGLYLRLAEADTLTLSLTLRAAPVSYRLLH